MNKVLLMLLCSVGLYAQECPYSLSGKVIDLHDNSALAGAQIFIEETSDVTLSDEQGGYRFVNLCPGNYTLLVNHPDCNGIQISIKLKENLEKDLTLEHHYQELNEVIVRGEQGIAPKSVGIQVLDQEQLSERSHETLGDALSRLSGVSRLQTGATISKPIIRGMHSSRVTIINSGVRLEDQEWGTEHAPNIALSQAQSVSLIKNSAALQYSGDAIGGVIIVSPERIAVKDSLYGHLNLMGQSNGRGGYTGAQLIRSSTAGWYTQVNVSKRKLGDLQAPNYLLSNTGVDGYSLGTRLGLNRFKFGFELGFSRLANNLGILSASHLGSAQDQFAAINSSTPLIVNPFSYDINRPKQNVTHDVFSLKGFIKTKTLGRVDLQYDFQHNHRLEFDVRRGNFADKPALDLDLKTQSLNLVLAPDINFIDEFKAGINFKFQDNVSNPETGVKRLIPDYSRWDIGVFLVGEREFSPNLILDFGLRGDFSRINAFKYYNTSLWDQRAYGLIFPEFFVSSLGTQVLTNPKFDYLNFSWSTGVRWQIKADQSLLFNASLGSRNPNVSELFSEGLHHSAARIEVGELSLKPERSLNFSMTHELKYEWLDLSLSPFYKRINSFILMEPTGVQQTIRGNFQVWDYRQTNAAITGIDLDARWRLTDEITFNQQFSLVKGYERDSKRPLINIPAAQMNHELNYQLTPKNNLTVGIQSRFTWEQNEYPDNNFLVYIPELDSQELLDISTPPEAYHLLDVNLKMTLSLLPKTISYLRFSIDNFMNVNYRDYLNSQRFYADDLGRNLRISLNTKF